MLCYSGPSCRILHQIPPYLQILAAFSRFELGWGASFKASSDYRYVEERHEQDKSYFMEVRTLCVFTLWQFMFLSASLRNFVSKARPFSFLHFSFNASPHPLGIRSVFVWKRLCHYTTALLLAPINTYLHPFCQVVAHVTFIALRFSRLHRRRSIP